MATEKRLIDANAFYNRLRNTVYDIAENDDFGHLQLGYSHDIISEVLKQTKTVDAVEVVRCKDCKFFHDKGYCTLVSGLCRIKPENDFCSHGERKDNGL